MTGAELAATEYEAPDGGARWGVTWHAHHGFVASIVARTVGNRDLVSDAVQDVWFEIWRSRHHFRGASHPRTWMYQIARWRALNFVRRERARARAEGEYATAATAMTVSPRESDPYLLAIILDACNQLPAGQRNVFLRHVLSDETHDEIAAALGISPVTSRAQLSRARASLRGMLTPHVSPVGARPRIKARPKHPSSRLA